MNIFHLDTCDIIYKHHLSEYIHVPTYLHTTLLHVKLYIKASFTDF